jgi:hypothetical protein
MSERTIVTIAEGPVTRLGQLVLAGEVIDAEPIMSSTLRVMDAYVLSVLIDGEGNYRDADGRDERLRPGTTGLRTGSSSGRTSVDPARSSANAIRTGRGPTACGISSNPSRAVRRPSPGPSMPSTPSR